MVGFAILARNPEIDELAYPEIEKLMNPQMGEVGNSIAPRIPPGLAEMQYLIVFSFTGRKIERLRS